MNDRLTLFAAFMTAVSAVPASAALPTLREPTGKWLVEYAKDQCLLSRGYGSEAAPLTLTFERLPMSSGVGAYIIRPTAKEDREWGPAEVGAGDGSTSASRYDAFTISGRKLRLINLGIPDDQVPAISRSEAIRIRASREKLDEGFALPRLAAALQALDECVIDLGRSWGFTVEQQNAVGKPAKPTVSLASHFSSDDYPSEALKNGDMGRVKVRISVTSSGAPSDCSMSRPSGSKLLDQTTCRILMKRARFMPAIGKDGKPMPSLYVTSVNWLLAG